MRLLLTASLTFITLECLSLSRQIAVIAQEWVSQTVDPLV